jgi:hypothetical protein
MFLLATAPWFGKIALFAAAFNQAFTAKSGHTNLDSAECNASLSAKLRNLVPAALFGSQPARLLT